MKFFGIAALTGFAAGNLVPVPIPTGLSNVGQFLNSASGMGIFGATDFTKVTQHGCHCVKFSNYSADQQGGEPVDALDAACKVFWERRSCIKLQGGTCNDYHHNGGNYPEAQYYATATMTANGLQVSPDPDFHCQAVKNPCLRDICEVDHATILTIVGGGLGTATWDWKFNSQCPGGRGIPNVEIPGFTCVGRGADATWAYKAQIPTRLEHANAFFQQASQTGLFGEVALTQIMNHGCHCKKLGDHEAEIQGGSTTVDALDNMCRNYFMKRNCLRSQAGFSGSCSAGYPADAYDIALKVTDVEKMSNGLGASIEWFADRQCHCSQLKESSCLYDICNIDHDTMYNGLMAAGIYNSNYDYIEAQQCVEPVRQAPQQRVCIGHVPDIGFKVVASSDPYELVACMIVDSYPDSVRNRLAAATGEAIDSIIEKLKTAYASGKSAVTDDEIQAIQNAINSNDSEGLNAIIQSNKQQLGAVMQSIRQEFGPSYPKVEDILIAHRMGHYVKGQDLYVRVLHAMMGSFSDDLVTTLESLIGDDALSKIRKAYLKGRSVVSKDELLAFQAAMKSGDAVRMDQLMNQFMAELGPVLNQIGAAFGPHFQKAISLIQADRLGHLEGGVDLYALVVDIIIDSYPGELVEQLKELGGDNVLLKLRGAYGAGRYVVDGQELRAIKAALDAQDFAEVNRLMAGFKNQMGSAMDQVAATFGEGFAEVENHIEAWRMDHLEDGDDLYAVVIELMINSYSDIHAKLQQVAGVDVLDRLRAAYAEGRHVVSGDDLREMNSALEAGNLTKVNALMQQFLASMGDALNDVAAAFGAGFDEVLACIQAYRMGHLDANGNDLYALVVNMIIDSYPTELIDQLKYAVGNDVVARLRQAYGAGRSVVDGQELQALKAALDAQNFPEVNRLMTNFKQQMGPKMADVAAAFGNGWDQMVNLIEAWRMDHLEDGEDLYAIVIELMINSYSDIHDNLKQLAGNDVLDRLRSAYQAGRQVISGDELRQMKAALEANDLTTVNTLMASALAQMGSAMDQVSAAFGTGFDEVLCMISAYRAGHIIGGVDMFKTVINNLVNSYPQVLVDQLKSELGNDVIERLRTAYLAGRSVVNAAELQQLADAVDNNDLQAQHTIITALKAEFAANMGAVKAAFGAGFDRMVQLIDAYRNGHLVEGVDLFEVAVDIIIDSYPSDLIALLKAASSDDVISRLRVAYFAGRPYVDHQELASIKAALDAQNFVEVQRLMAGFKNEMGDALNDVAAAFGAGFAQVEQLIEAWRMDHLEDGQDLYGVVVEMMINSYSDIHQKLREIAGNDVLNRLRAAYAEGREVVSGNDLRELQNALNAGNLGRVNELMQQFLAALGSEMNAISAAFGAGFDDVLHYISAFRAGHLDSNGNDLYAIVVNTLIDSYPTELVDQLKFIVGDDVLSRLRNAYEQGRPVIDGDELREFKAALDAQNFPEVNRLMNLAKQQLGSRMSQIAASFGSGWDDMVARIEAWRMDHLEDGEDLFAIVIELMINSYSDIHDNLKQLAGNDVLDRLRTAYQAGRQVMSGDELRQMKAALDANDLATVNTLMTSALIQMGSAMDQVSAAFGAGFEEVLCMIQAYRAGHIINGVDFFATVIDNLIASYPPALVSQLESELGNDVMAKLRRSYFAGRSVVDAAELQQLADAVSSGDTARQHELINGFKAEFAQHMGAVKAAFGAGFDRMVQLIDAYRNGHLVGGVDLYEVAVNIIIDSYDANLIALLKAASSDDVIARLRVAYFAGRAYVNPQELASIKAALDAQNFVEVQRLMAGFKNEMGAAMNDVAAAFGSGFAEVEQLIEAWRMDHLEDGQDLYGIVVELMINSYSDIHYKLKQIAGNDVLDRLRDAYAEGREVMSGDELRQMKAALDANDLATVNSLMESALAQMGTKMDQVAAAFGAGFDQVLSLISAYRSGHLDDNGNDLYAYVVNMIIDSYPTELVDLMKAASSDDVLDRLRVAYNAGRHVVDGQELRDLKAAIDAQNFVEVQHLMTDLKTQMGSAMDDVSAAFGANFAAVENLIEAWRMDHLEDGNDLYAIVIELMINSFSDIHDDLIAIDGADVLNKIRVAYAAGRNVVSGDDLRLLQTALNQNNLQLVNELLAQFIAALGQNMDAIADAFGPGFDAVLNHKLAYYAGHLVDGVDIFAQVINQLINSYPSDLVAQLQTAVGDDVMQRLRAAYMAGRSVVDASEIQALATAIADNDLQAQHNIITALKAEFAANMDAVKAAFGPGFDTMESIIIQYRTNNA